MEHVILVEFELVPETAAEFERLIVENATRSVAPMGALTRMDPPSTTAASPLPI